jgi:hypothetical protein
MGDEETIVEAEWVGDEWIQSAYVGARLGREKFRKNVIIKLTPERKKLLEGVPDGTFKIHGHLPKDVIERARANGDLVE